MEIKVTDTIQQQAWMEYDAKVDCISGIQLIILWVKRHTFPFSPFMRSPWSCTQHQFLVFHSCCARPIVVVTMSATVGPRCRLQHSSAAWNNEGKSRKAHLYTQHENLQHSVQISSRILKRIWRPQDVELFRKLQAKLIPFKTHFKTYQSIRF